MPLHRIEDGAPINLHPIEEGFYPLKLASGLGLQTSLSAFWSLEDNSWTDDTVNANTLTGVNAPAAAAAKVGNGVSIVKASSQYLTINSNSTLQVGTSTYSIQAWINTGANPQDFITKNGAFGNEEFSLLSTFTSGNFWAFRIIDNNGNNYNAISSVGTNSGAWFHIVATWDGTTQKIYVNTTMDSNVPSFGGNHLIDSTQPFRIGATGGGNEMNNDATIDQVGIWKGRVLNSTEVGQLYNSGNGLSYAAMA